MIFDNENYEAFDQELWAAVHAEKVRQQNNIELIASENVVSKAVMAAQGSVLTNKYAEGYPGKRYYGGTDCVNVVENLAIDRAKELFGAAFANAYQKGDKDMIFDNENYEAFDQELWAAVHAEKVRQQNNIELIASENVVSKAVMAAQGSVLTNKYAEGYPGKRYYGGTDCVNVVENLAIDRAKELFGAAFANAAAYMALIQPGDTVLGMDLAAGGHLTHGAPVSFSGKTYHFVSYTVDPVTECIDYDALAQLALKTQPKLIVAGASAYSRIIDFKRFRDIADSVGAYLMVDMAHIAGLVASGHHPSPVPYAHITTSTPTKPYVGLVVA